MTKETTVRQGLILGATLVTASLILTGCGRGDDAPGDSQPAAAIDDEPATGTVEFWAFGAEGEALPAFLQTFEEENPDVTVNVTAVPTAEFEAKLTAAIAGGAVPDAVFLSTQTQRGFFETGAFEAVPDGLVDDADFFPIAVEGTTIDEVSYGVPWYLYSRVMYYRSDLADDLGLSAPETWEEMRDFLQEFKDAGADIPLSINLPWARQTAEELMSFSAQNGGSFISDDLSEWTIDTPENVEALDYWASLVTDGLASADGPLFEDVTPYITEGKSVAKVNGPWMPAGLDAANGEGWSEEHIAAILPPAGPEGSAAAIGGGTLAVLKDGENTDAGWKLVRWLAEPETQSEWYDTFGNLPAVESVWDTNDSISGSALTAPVREGIENGVVAPPVSTWAEVGGVIAEQMERVARGQATPEEALATAQERAEAIGTGD